MTAIWLYGGRHLLMCAERDTAWATLQFAVHLTTYLLSVGIPVVALVMFCDKQGLFALLALGTNVVWRVRSFILWLGVIYLILICMECVHLRINNIIMKIMWVCAWWLAPSLAGLKLQVAKRGGFIIYYYFILLLEASMVLLFLNMFVSDNYVT